MERTIKGKKVRIRKNSIAYKFFKVVDAFKPKNDEDVKMYYAFAGAMFMLAFLVIGEMGLRASGL